MSVQVMLQDKTLLAKQKKEDKENVNRSTCSQEGRALETNLLSPKALKSPAILKETTRTTNCNSSVAVSEAETKNLQVSFNQTFLLERSTKEREPKTATPKSDVNVLKTHVLGSYRGRIVSSKINSFRKVSGNESRKNCLAASPKGAGGTGLGSPSEPVVTTALQSRPPVRVLVSRPRPILHHEKQSLNSSSVKKRGVQRRPDKKGIPQPTAAHSAKTSGQRTEKIVPSQTVTGSVSETRAPGCMFISKPVLGNGRSTLPESAEVRRGHLAKWQASKGTAIKKGPAPSLPPQPEKERRPQTLEEPAKSFWVTIVEEDEQSLFSETVNKMLAECLQHIEEGLSSDKVHSILEELILTIPQAKKLVKYWVCRMRLEQFSSLERVMAVYEEAILTGVQPKDELRHVLVDIVKDIKKLPKLSGERLSGPDSGLRACGFSEEHVKREISPEPTAAVKLEAEKVENAFAQVCSDPALESGEDDDDEACQKAGETGLKPKPESSPTVEQSQNPTLGCPEQQGGGDEAKNIILGLKTPENDDVGSYVIKYNISTTPSLLERMKKKLQSNANDPVLKEIKFLTPVRRSRRVQESMCKLPDMLKDHSPSVSSLKQLGELMEETNTFIIRPNDALPKVCTHPEEQKQQ